jgi:2-oxoglutarate dehydrogenase E2 component (dihydrolipoamide succinyltransferase)
MEELEQIEGSGAQGRVSKQDVLDYLESRGEAKPAPAAEKAEPKAEKPPVQSLSKPVDSKEKPDTSRISAGEINVHWPAENVEIVKMDRMRKVIAEHMIRSKQTSAHVTTFGEADVTKLVKFRNRHKDRFFKENGFKLTFTPFFIEATIQAIREFPLINSSVDGENILLKRDINYGIAVALGESGTGGLIVPVIKNAGEMNIHGLARATHDLAEKARSKKLSPDDLVGGTFTLTNYGSVGNLMGTPIINQPQVAIFGTGVIQKRPMVMETEVGDVIAVRHMVYLSMSYDHRIVDGALGGAFVQKVIKNLENFDVNRSV